MEMEYIIIGLMALILLVLLGISNSISSVNRKLGNDPTVWNIESVLENLGADISSIKETLESLEKSYRGEDDED